MKKIVRSSNLNLRFYKRDGWDLATLERYLQKGSWIDTEFSHHQDSHEDAYFILHPGSRLDMPKLHLDEVSSVVRAYNDHPDETDLQFMERMNW